MKRRVIACGLAWGIWLAPAVASERPGAPPPAGEAAERSEAAGEFAEADRLLAVAAAKAGVAPAERWELAWKRERLRRIRMDYALSREDLLAALRRGVRDLTESEFEGWLLEGRFDGRRIDGVMRFLNASVSNLFFRHPELEARRVKAREPAALERALWENAQAIRMAARSAGSPYVLPKAFRVRMRLGIEGGIVAGGEQVRVWVPVPRRYPYQGGFVLVRSTPPVQGLAPPESPIRSVYLEAVGRGGEPLRFEVEYEYATRGVWFDLDPARSVALGPEDQEAGRFLEEGPHLVFSGAMRQLAGQLAGAESNLVRKAKAFYDWMAGNILYSFAPEYSTIENLGEFCRSRGYGDCGQEAFLFMTLCRLSGIPARWQSGWSIFPGAETIHDWCEIYLKPWGWVPVDPYMGIYATRYVRSLPAEQRRELSDFYFGGLSQYRLAANSDHSRSLTPAKESFRSDTVDFQRGEVEAGGRALYFGEFNYALEWEEAAGEGARP